MRWKLYGRCLGAPTLCHLTLVLICYFTYFSAQALRLEREWESITLAFIGGILSWTLLEYTLHRFVSHRTTLRAGDKRRGPHLMHHDAPEKPEDTITPLFNSLLLGVVIFFLLWGLSRSLSWALLWFPGMVVGYVFYEWLHFTIHTYKPGNRLLKKYFDYHLYHHYKKPRRHFGVTSPLWDFLFGTVR